MIRQHVLHAIEDPLAGAALLEIHHVAPGSLGPALHLVGPATDVGHLGCTERTADDEVPVALERGDLRAAERPCGDGGRFPTKSAF